MFKLLRDTFGDSGSGKSGSTFDADLNEVAEAALWLKSMEKHSYERTAEAIRQRWPSSAEEHKGPGVRTPAIYWSLCNARFSASMSKELAVPGMSDKLTLIVGNEDYYRFHLAVGVMLSPSVMESQVTKPGRLARKFCDAIKQRDGFESIDDVMRSLGIRR